MRYILVVLLITRFVAADVHYQCPAEKPEFNLLFGKYCYHVYPFPSSITYDFGDQVQYCDGKGSYLAGFDTKDEQKALVDYMLQTYGNDFQPFIIGLTCFLTTPGKEHWTWINPAITYNSADAAFESKNFDNYTCSHDDSNTHFGLTPSSKWRQMDTSDMLTQFDLLVCQIKANEAPSDPAPPYDDTGLVIGLGITCAILIFVIIFLVAKFRKKIAALMEQVMQSSRERRRGDHEGDVEKSAADLNKDDWEVGRQFIEIDYSTKLGTGAFGVVYLGQIDVERLPKSAERSLLQLTALKLNNGRIAVKLLHESADRLAEVDFLQEIELMKCIGYHERLVNIIASVTESLPHLLALEYCSQGDLLSYLKQRREYMIQLPANADYALVDRSLLITQEKQLQFAVQIACGLEFLSGRGFVHRDIAARNILVDERNGCKIGDFGLCRRVQQEQELYLSRGGLLPIKWMSPEALRRYEMSTASDVWSYGILLFEIITLGGSPYPNWEPSEILPRLEAGERMDRPDNCPDAVFEAMTECWNDIPIKRPNFTTLRSRLAKALEESPSEYYLQLDSQRDYYMVPRSKDLPVPEEEFIRVV